MVASILPPERSAGRSSWTFERKPSRAQAHGARGSSDSYVGVSEVVQSSVDLVPRGLPSDWIRRGPEGWGRREWQAHTADSMARWLAPIPWRLFGTIAAQDSLGPGGYQEATRLLVARVADMSDTYVANVGALLFVAPHQSGELHGHTAIAGPESVLGINRVEVARYVEAECGRLHKMELAYDQEPNRARVDLDKSRGWSSVLGYCAIQYGSDQAGELREVGLNLGALLERYG